MFFIKILAVSFDLIALNTERTKSFNSKSYYLVTPNIEILDQTKLNEYTDYLKKNLKEDLKKICNYHITLMLKKQLFELDIIKDFLDKKEKNTLLACDIDKNIIKQIDFFFKYFFNEIARYIQFLKLLYKNDNKKSTKFIKNDKNFDKEIISIDFKPKIINYLIDLNFANMLVNFEVFKNKIKKNSNIKYFDILNILFEQTMIEERNLSKIHCLNLKYLDFKKLKIKKLTLTTKKFMKKNKDLLFKLRVNNELIKAPKIDCCFSFYKNIIEYYFEDYFLARRSPYCSNLKNIEDITKNMNKNYLNTNYLNNFKLCYIQINKLLTKLKNNKDNIKKIKKDIFDILDKYYLNIKKLGSFRELNSILESILITKEDINIIYNKNFNIFYTETYKSQNDYNNLINKQNEYDNFLKNNNKKNLIKRNYKNENDKKKHLKINEKTLIKYEKINNNNLNSFLNQNIYSSLLHTEGLVKKDSSDLIEYIKISLIDYYKYKKDINNNKLNVEEFSLKIQNILIILYFNDKKFSDYFKKIHTNIYCLMEYNYFVNYKIYSLLLDYLESILNKSINNELYNKKYIKKNLKIKKTMEPTEFIESTEPTEFIESTEPVESIENEKTIFNLNFSSQEINEIFNEVFPNQNYNDFEDKIKSKSCFNCK